MRHPLTREQREEFYRLQKEWIDSVAALHRIYVTVAIAASAIAGTLLAVADTSGSQRCALSASLLLAALGIVSSAVRLNFQARLCREQCLQFLQSAERGETGFLSHVRMTKRETFAERAAPILYLASLALLSASAFL